jgi:hypothetical protein
VGIRLRQEGEMSVMSCPLSTQLHDLLGVDFAGLNRCGGFGMDGYMQKIFCLITSNVFVFHPRMILVSISIQVGR